MPNHRNLKLFVYLFPLLAIFLIDPMGNGTYDVPKDDLVIKVFGLDETNKGAYFKTPVDGRAMFRSGIKEAVRAEITFQTDVLLQFEHHFRWYGEGCSQTEPNQKGRFSIYSGNETVLDRSRVDGLSYSGEVDVSMGNTLSIEVSGGDVFGCDRSVLSFRGTEQAEELKRLLIYLMPLLLVWLGVAQKAYPGTIVGSLIFVLYLAAEKYNFGPLRFHAILGYVFLATSVAWVTTVLLFVTHRPHAFMLRILSVVGFLLVMLLPVFYVSHYISFGVPVHEEIWFAIFQSNAGESAEFLTDQIAWWVLLAGAAMLALSVWAALRAGHRELPREQKRVIALSTLSICLAPIAFTGEMRPLQQGLESYRLYEQELQAFQAALADRVGASGLTMTKQFSAVEKHVVVIGESASSHHWSAYGYHRDTTPVINALMEEGQLLLFQNAYSSHTHTMPVLSQALTEANQTNGKHFRDSASIVEAAKYSGFKSYWLSNQVKMGAWDNLVSVVSSIADHSVRINKGLGKSFATSRYDSDLIPYAEQILRKASESQIVFIHIMGSHGWYCNRFPDQAHHFADRSDWGEVGKFAAKERQREKLDCYDASIRFTDQILGELIQILDSQDQVSTLTYFSDHGEDVFTGFGHNSAKFTYEMVDIPFVIWMSDEYRNANPDKTMTLREHQTALFSNDYMYDTLTGLWGIETAFKQNDKDLSDASYQLEKEKSYTLHGRKKYIDSPSYHFRMNANELGDGSARVIVHRANTTGKAAQALRSGFNGFELDALIRDEGYFEVGHGEGAMSETSLYEFLEALDLSNTNKIWLDLKNLSEENLTIVKERLDALESAFDLHSKLIFETSSTSSEVRQIARAGYHVSYYLPTFKVLEAYQEDNSEVLKQTSQAVLDQVSRQELSAISFDNRLYPFVKEHIEPYLEPGIVYHTWDMSLKMSEKRLKERLAATDYFPDERVQTILIPHRSPFSL